MSKTESLPQKTKKHTKIRDWLDDYLFLSSNLPTRLLRESHSIQNRLNGKSLLKELFLIFLPGILLFFFALGRKLYEGRLFSEIVEQEMISYVFLFSAAVWAIKIFIGFFDWFSIVAYQKWGKSSEKKEHYAQNNLWEKIRIGNYLFTPFCVGVFANIIGFAIADFKYSVSQMSLWFSIEFLIIWLWQTVYLVKFYINYPRSFKIVGIFSGLLWIGAIFAYMMIVPVIMGSGPWYYQFMFNIFYIV